MSSSRIYIGNLPPRTNERDVESFLRGFGRIREVILKGAYGFVQFDDARDANDACTEMNNRDMNGSRVVVEACRRSARDRDDRRSDYRSSSDHRGGYRGSDYRRDSRSKSSRYGPPVQTRYRLIVENLSTRCSWQDLKDLMRNAGEVTYADAHKKERNKALVCFQDHEGLKKAIEKYQDKDINGRRIKLIDDSEERGSRSHSGSRNRNVSRSRSPGSRSRSPIQQNGRSASRRMLSSNVENLLEIENDAFLVLMLH
ncbi:hypothetical protein M3Y96_00650000 [Aphelenchoides besseyi]|nr:hypothetical protein M3Y96_00650000 [Aphelenchoides besseyi]